MKPKSKNHGKEFLTFDDRPIEDENELYCDPLEDSETAYFSKIKEKQRFDEKNKENDDFYG